MQTVTANARNADPSAAKIDFRDLQGDALLVIGFGVCAAACIILVAEETVSGYSALLWPVTLLVLLAAAVGLLKPRSYLAAAWTLVAGLVVIIVLMITPGQAPESVFLLALPAALAAFLISARAGAGVAAACSALLFFAALPLPGPFTHVFAAMQIWGTVGLIALAERPLLTVAEWSWSSYERSRDLLDQARDYQVQLKQALQDLASANLQLSRLNEQARVMRQVAEDARRAKEQFVANVSHELRTPLNMIIGFAEMMMQSSEIYETKLPPALLADLAVIRRNSQHLSSLIDDVLDLSQIESGHMALSRERVDLPEIIDAAMVAVLPLFRSKGLYLEKEALPDLPRVYCDRTRIREVILNLLSNAGRFTEHGGVRIRAWCEGNDTIISIADSGPGIKASDRERIFNPFQQVDSSIRRRYGGTGLGLSISRSFIELHGGRMWLDSIVGVGTTVFFSIPIDPPAQMETDAAHWLNPAWEYEQRTHRNMVAPATIRPRLVVCERADSLQRLLGRYLDQVEIVHAATLDQAMTELERVPSQALVINDSTAGASPSFTIGQATLPAGVPAIVCSLPDTNIVQSRGVADYLVKPVSRSALLAALDRLALSGKTLLIVDDEPEAVRLFKRMLASAGRGYRVLTANDGEHAMSVLRAQHPDALLLDLVMPNMDGFQVLARKNEDPDLRSIPVVVLSAQNPAGGPIVSNAMSITQGGGLSVQQLLSLIEMSIRVLAPMRRSGDPAQTAAPAGSLACAETPPRQSSAPGLPVA